jgi:uncharacterized protein YbcI
MTATIDAADQGRLIADEIARLHREFHGRGAANARVILGDHELVVLLEDIYTPGERTLINDGQFKAVKESRQAFQMAMRERFSDAVELVTGRHVTAFMSQVHHDPDLAVEIFILGGAA